MFKTGKKYEYVWLKVFHVKTESKEVIHVKTESKEIVMSRQNQNVKKKNIYLIKRK